MCRVLCLTLVLTSLAAEAEAPVAVLFGKRLFVKDLGADAARHCGALQGLVWDAVFTDYVKQHALAPTKKELAACKTRDRTLARAWLGAWKRDVALYREYGGRVIFQQHGLEPIDAWRKLLERYEARGSFVVNEPKLSGCVFSYFTLSFFDVGEEATNRWLSDPMCPD